MDRATNEHALNFVLDDTFKPGEEEIRNFTVQALDVALDRAYRARQVSADFGERQQTQCLQEIR